MARCPATTLHCVYMVQVVEELYKVASISLSPNVNGQLMMGLMVNPPKPGDYSHHQYAKER